MFDQIHKHRSNRSETIKQVEHKPDHTLCLLVGIKNHFARRALHVAHRHGLRELTTPRLG
ncbi:hypothetical protein AQZ50_18760 [Novosphingobium sp. Fuku2-ISO-50]|nr:hypothetical protein AQZ50_18760 [Novosphingobium sp. Fuku2-ISO-50]